MALPTVVFNPHAGAGGERRRLVSALESRVAEGRIRLVTTHTAEEGRRATAEAWSGGAPVVVAAGGDGTVNATVGGLLDAEGERPERPRFGLVPCGRGNDLARALGIPRSGEPALELALAGNRTVGLDVGMAEVDGRTAHFVNALGAGFDGAVAREAKRVRLSGFGAYLWAILKVLRSGEGPWRLVGVLDAAPVELTLTLFSAGNGPTTGGGFRLVPQADPTDGRLDYCLGERVSLGAILTILPRVMMGTHGGHPRIQLGSFESFRGVFSPPAPLHADGEILAEAASRLRIWVRPGALAAIVPPTR